MEKAFPKAFKKYFWDTDINKLSPLKNRAYVIERLFEYGDVQELDWLNYFYSKEDLITTLKTSRRISPKTGNFFALYYHVPKESLACMKKPSI